MVTKPSGIKDRYLAGGSWKTKVFGKKTKGSQTPGKKKNPDTCQASAAKKFFAKRSRSYKSTGFGEFGTYSAWCLKMDSINGGKR